MEHHQRLLHLSPHQHQEHLMIGQGFFDVDPMHFHGEDGGFAVEPAAAGVDDGAWMEDLMHLGDELFGGGGGGGGDVAGDENDMVGAAAADQAWRQECEGASPDDNPCSYDDVISPVSGEQGPGCEPSRDDSDLSGTRKRRDRSKTIVSERKRRFRMKEKLYELRALVPNITKMDKASIIADAVAYVKNLQSHARKLKEDVATLEARPGLAGRRQQQQQQQKQGRRQGQHGRNGGDDEGNSGSSRGGGGARVTLVSAAQVGEGRFFVTVECERRDGVAAPLCAAVESLAGFLVESSNLGCSSDRVVSTLTLKVSEATEEVMISDRTVKLWVMAALLSEGFRPEATSEIC
ncbi:hypothetical protein ZWY2020_057042 [Hordeum vulgare]|nr:hypothetical protein ZWY2020_057042 [Hordeum vulgare]